MSLIYDALGNVIGDDGATNWDAPATPQEAALIASLGQNPATVGPSDVGYFQGKINEFQATLDAVDATAFSLSNLLGSGIATDQQAAIQAQLDEYAARKAAFKFAAESFNAVAAMVNAVGGSMASVTIPTGLGFAPLVLPVAVGVAVAGAAVLVAWASGWLDASNKLALDALATIPPGAVHDAAAAQIVSAVASATGTSALGSVASTIKYVAIAAAVYFGYKLLVESKGRA
jgi:hypothetical protein